VCESYEEAAAAIGDRASVGIEVSRRPIASHAAVSLEGRDDAESVTQAPPARRSTDSAAPFSLRSQQRERGQRNPR